MSSNKEKEKRRKKSVETEGKEGTWPRPSQAHPQQLFPHCEWQNLDERNCECGSQTRRQSTPRSSVCASRTFSGILITASPQCAEAHTGSVLPIPGTGTLAQPAFPAPSPAQAIAVTFHLSSLRKKHSGRKLLLLEAPPGPESQGDCASQPGGQHFPRTVHSLITQRENNLGSSTGSFLFFPLFTRWLRADKASH